MHPHVDELSILIPTFNRSEKLLFTLRALVPQCRASGAKITILDNASPVPVEALLRENFPNDGDIVSVVRN